jgi:RimJ/RimL family protein N-acetyltransferase
VLEKVKTTLRRAEKKDIPELIELSGDTDALFNLFGMTEVDKEGMSAVIEQILENSYRTPPSEILLIVEGQGPVGEIYLSGIDWINRNLFVSFAVKKELRNTIYGLKVAVEALRFSFEQLNMHRLCSHVNENNTSMQRICENFYGVKEGVLGNFIIRDGQRQAAFKYAFFRKDYPSLLEKLKNY